MWIRSGTNRTVVTFVGGAPALLSKQPFWPSKSRRTDRHARQPKAHTRVGATDVCRLVPISGISVEECIHFAG
ncbi:MAG: hypothetical protein R3B47_12025 [Bacteroidia bacterium]